MSRGLAAVTGATGFLGRRLTAALTARDWRVRALVRSASPNLDAELIRGDLADTEALDQLVEGADVVLHCAGLIKARRAGEFAEVNVEGSRRLAEAVARDPARRMILISSLAAREPSLSPYAASKRAAETAAREALGARLTIVRPPAIYGPGDRETLAIFQLASRSPLLPLAGGPHARLAFAHVEDVAEACLRWLEPPPAPGPFAIGGARPEGYSWREILGAAAAALGRRPRFATVPNALVIAAAAISQSLGGLAPAPPIFTLGKAREFLHPDWAVTAGEQAPDAPAARFDLERGFADTVRWYRAEGWLT